MQSRTPQVLVGALIASVACVAQAGGPAIAAVSPRSLAGAIEQALRGVEDAPEEEVEALAQAMRGLKEPERGLAYADMSEGRREKLNEFLAQAVRSRPTGAYATPLQLEAKIANLQVAVYMFAALPVFTTSDSEELTQQLAELRSAIADGVFERVPQVKGSAVEEEIRAVVEARLKGMAEDDMTPAFKLPLPAGEFLALREQAAAGCAAAPALLMFPEGHLLDGWDGLSADYRAYLLHQKRHEIAPKLFAPFEAVCAQAAARYAMHAIETKWPDADLTGGLEAVEQQELAELTARAQAERTRIREEEAARQREEDEAERTRMAQEAEGFITAPVDDDQIGVEQDR